MRSNGSPSALSGMHALVCTSCYSNFRPTNPASMAEFNAGIALSRSRLCQETDASSRGSVKACRDSCHRCSRCRWLLAESDFNAINLLQELESTSVQDSVSAELAIHFHVVGTLCDLCRLCGILSPAKFKHTFFLDLWGNKTDADAWA